MIVPLSSPEAADASRFGPKAANLALASIDPNGLIHYRAVSSQSGARTLAECLRSTGASVSAAPVVASSP